MKKQFVSYEIAKELKALGFDDETLGHYLDSGWELLIMENKFMHESHTKAPLWQLDFFREKKMEVLITEINKEYFYDIRTETDRFFSTNGYKKYESCREKAILKAIEIQKKLSE